MITMMTALHEVEIQGLWARVGLLAQAAQGLAPVEELEQLRALNERAQAIGPLLDPTAYMRLDHEQVRATRLLLDATITYVNVVTDVLEKIAPMRPQSALAARSGRPAR